MFTRRVINNEVSTTPAGFYICSFRDSIPILRGAFLALKVFCAEVFLSRIASFLAKTGAKEQSVKQNLVFKSLHPFQVKFPVLFMLFIQCCNKLHLYIHISARQHFELS